ncbi:MAG: hypothetical protein M1821_008454 [Bathelium mastoideum]|nr:MAG: hypothetical protein M1821_008454 [Bathelium mastoideum]
MGRRKIEIKAIKDDRNRSVTFLKRKGGLFKKAHELSVLCSVDVAVIIFGNNKKLYEFSSGDINETLGRYQYYGGAHEHKGPADFMGKRDGDDDDEDDENVGSQHGDSHSPPEQPQVPYGLTNHPNYQHMRQHTASASPPLPNGSIPFHQRQGTPQPMGGGSRPGSRNAFRRTSSNLVPQHPSQVTQGPPGPTGYAYVPNAPMYSGPATAPMQMPRPVPPPNQPQHQYSHPPPQQGHVYQAYMQEQRRQSMPPAFPPQPQPQPQQQQPPPQQERPPQVHQPSPPQPEQNHFRSPPLPQQQQHQPKPLSQAAKSHSIFTPVDDTRSLLAQHWGGTSIAESSKPDPVAKSETGPRSQSIDVASMQRVHVNGDQPPVPQQQRPPPAPVAQPQRTSSTSSMPSFGPPSRTNSMPDAKRPRLKVQIPSEQSDGGEGTADSSPKESATGQTPAKREGEQNHGGVVLPPPSPSASALLSAGAQGPPNPFARPAPPMNSYSTAGNNKDIETPISALPSRFVDGNLLPSPSSFYPPEWGFGRGDSNILPSPLNFPTPVATNGPSFRDEDMDRKRKTSEGSENGASKRIKS